MVSTVARGLSAVSPEWRVVLSGARTLFDPEALRRSQSLSPRLDWERVVEIAWPHRVAPILYSAFGRTVPGIPKRVLRRLERGYVATAARNALLFRALREILEALAAAGVPAIALKGAMLADTVYRERALRPMSDIDLLIHEQDLDLAERRLRGIGYESMHDAETKAELRRRHHHWVFRRPTLSGIPLEPHWLLHPPDSPFRVDTAALWQRAVPTRIAGVDALGLSAEDLLLHLCTHGARHRFNGGLLFLVDIAAAITHYGDRIDWARLEARAAEWGAGPHVSVALRLASELLGAGVPARTLEKLRPSSPDDDLIDLARERVLEEKGPLRKAAELRLRWRESGSRERRDALRRVLRPAAMNGNGSAKTPLPVPVGERIGRFLPLTWTLLRHPRAVAAIVRREAKKSRLDSWCSEARE
jgi:hypothetical protein